MIYYFSPYSTDKDLGKAYNDHMKLLPNGDDWACLTDGDVMFLHSGYGHQLQAMTILYPNTGMFTCLTNRVGTLAQCYGGEISEDFDLVNHKHIAADLALAPSVKEMPGPVPVSGHLMLIKKSVWEKLGGFPELPEGKGILGVDNAFCYKLHAAGLKILLMEHVYVFHQYRMIYGINDKSHLLRA